MESKRQIYPLPGPSISVCTAFLLKKQTCARHSDDVAALTDQVVHDSHHSELIPGLLSESQTHHSLTVTLHCTHYVIEFLKIWPVGDDDIHYNSAELFFASHELWFAAVLCVTVLQTTFL